jgi:Tol biopolymer transport system component
MDMNLWVLLIYALTYWFRLLALLEGLKRLLESTSARRLPGQTTSEGAIRTDVTWSPDGTQLAYALSDGTVSVWDVSAGTLLLTYRGHADWVTSVAWSPDGRAIASAGYDGTVQLWHPARGELLLTYRGHCDEVRRVAWSPDGTAIASAGYDRSIQVWDATTGETLCVCRGHTNVVTSVAWSPDGAYLVSGSRDHTVRLWYAANGDELALVHEHRGMVNDVEWSPQPGLFAFASASNDTTVKVWQMEPETFSCTCLSSYERHVQTGGVVAVAWSPDGKRIISVDRATMHEWTVHAPQASVVLPIPRPAPFHRSEVFALDSRALRRHPAYPDGTLIAIAGEGWIYLGDSPATALVEEWSPN